jgi:hypothetical protein
MLILIYFLRPGLVQMVTLFCVKMHVDCSYFSPMIINTVSPDLLTCNNINTNSSLPRCKADMFCYPRHTKHIKYPFNNQNEGKIIYRLSTKISDFSSTLYNCWEQWSWSRTRASVFRGAQFYQGHCLHILL